MRWPRSACMRVGWSVAMGLLGCSATLVAPPPAEPSPPAEAEAAPAEPNAPRDELAEVRQAIAARVAEERLGATEIRVGGALGEGRAEVEGPDFTLAFSYWVRPDGTVFMRDGHALEAVRFLKDLAGAGVSLEATGQRLATEAGPLACRLGRRAEETYECQQLPEPEAMTPGLDRPDYLVPPSQRARPRPQRRAVQRPTGPVVDVPEITDALAGHPDFEVEGVRLDEEHRALLVTTYEGPRIGAALCVTHRGRLHCTATELDGLQGLVSAADDYWLMLADSGYGTNRSRETLLVTLALEGTIPSLHTLGMGAMSGYGEACPNGSGYCVLVRASSILTRLVADGCIERIHEGEWRATHQRGGDRWVDEVVTPREAGPCVERWSYGAEGFERTGCGPPSTTPTCPDEVATVTLP